MSTPQTPPTIRQAPEHVVRRRVRVLDLQRRTRLPALLIELIEEQGVLLADMSAEFERSAIDLETLADEMARRREAARQTVEQLNVMRLAVPKSKKGKTMMLVLDGIIAEMRRTL